MIDRGRGSPLVLIPGIQGRCEWMGPAIDTLARNHRVLSFSLDDVRDEDLFEGWTRAIDRLIERTGERRASVVGISFGGLIAAQFAARRQERVTSLVLVSTPAPRCRLDATSERYLRRPRLALPRFAIGAVGRLGPEILAACPSWRSRVRFAVQHVARVVGSPPSPTRMAAAVSAWRRADIPAACRAITAPTLVITGERHLDRVVPVGDSLEYLALIPGATHVTIAETGHIGLLLKPPEFARLVTDFIAERAAGAETGAAASEPRAT